MAILKEKKVIIIEEKKDTKKGIKKVIRMPVIKAIIIKNIRVIKVIKEMMLLMALEITWCVYRMATLWKDFYLKRFLNTLLLTVKSLFPLGVLYVLNMVRKVMFSRIIKY